MIDPPTRATAPAPGVTYDDLLARGRDDDAARGPSTTSSGTISINYTSGTTGRPKGVMYSHRGAYLNSLGEIVHSFHTHDSVYLWTLPMFHCNGWCTPVGASRRSAAPTSACARCAAT